LSYNPSSFTFSMFLDRVLCFCLPYVEPLCFYSTSQVAGIIGVDHHPGLKAGFEDGSRKTWKTYFSSFSPFSCVYFSWKKLTKRQWGSFLLLKSKGENGIPPQLVGIFIDWLFIVVHRPLKTDKLPWGVVEKENKSTFSYSRCLI
jgi:hypothetical protein